MSATDPNTDPPNTEAPTDAVHHPRWWIPAVTAIALGLLLVAGVGVWPRTTTSPPPSSRPTITVAATPSPKPTTKPTATPTATPSASPAPPTTDGSGGDSGSNGGGGGGSASGDGGASGGEDTAPPPPPPPPPPPYTDADAIAAVQNTYGGVPVYATCWLTNYGTWTRNSTPPPPVPSGGILAFEAGALDDGTGGWVNYYVCE